MTNNKKDVFPPYCGYLLPCKICDKTNIRCRVFEDGGKAEMDNEQVCFNCLYSELEPTMEPCKSCSHNYTDNWRSRV